MQTLLRKTKCSGISKLFIFPLFLPKCPEIFLWSSLWLLDKGPGVRLTNVGGISSDWAPLEFLTLEMDQQFINYNSVSYSDTGSCVAFCMSISALLLCDIFSSACVSSFGVSSLSCDPNSLTENYWFFSLVSSLLVVRTEWWLLSSLCAGPETGSHLKYILDHCKEIWAVQKKCGCYNNGKALLWW